MTSFLKKTISHGSIYALGDVARNLTSFIMLPIYTTYLSPADYGVIELLSMLLDFVSIVLGMRVGEAVFRFYCSTDDPEEKKKIISTAMLLVIGLNGIGVVLVGLFSNQLSMIVFGEYGLSHFIALFTIVLVLQAIIELSLVYIRANQKPWMFITVSISRLVLQLVLNIYFVVIKGMHVEGVIYSAIIANSIIALILTIYVIQTNGISFCKNYAKELTLFSLPLMMASIGSFYLTFGDRYFLRIYSGISEVGIYSLGYKFGFMLLMLTWVPFERIWDTQRYEVHKLEKSKRIHIFGRTFIYISSFTIFVALGIALFVKDVLIIISDVQFHSAFKVVPFILLAYILQSWTAYCGFGLLIKKRTKHFTYAAIFSVTIISIAYLTLIPAYGAMGAAYATILGFLARLLWVQYQSNKIYKMELPWVNVFSILILAVGIYIASYFLPVAILPSILSRIGLVILFIILYFSLPILNSDEKAYMFTLLRHPGMFKMKRNKKND